MQQFVKSQRRSNYKKNLTKVLAERPREDPGPQYCWPTIRLSAFLSVIKRFTFWNSNEIQKSNKKHHCFQFWIDAVARSVKFVYPVVSSNSIQLLLLFAQTFSKHEDCRLCSLGRWCRISFCLEPLQRAVLIKEKHQFEECKSW